MIKLMLLGMLFLNHTPSAADPLPVAFSNRCFAAVANMARAGQTRLYGLAAWVDRIEDPPLDLMLKFLMAYPEECLADMVVSTAQE
jgi:hypothetical protein